MNLDGRELDLWLLTDMSMCGRKVWRFQLFAKGFLAVFCFICIGLVANAKPVISKASLHFDFARIEAMASPTNAMEIANTGDPLLEIHRVRACCGSTASITTNNIAPGAAATLTVSLMPMPKAGTFRKKVTLYTNDPSAPVVEIPIVGEVAEAKVEVKGDEVVVASNSGMSIG